MEKKIREIYEMCYDRDYNEDGTMRPNKHLGRFEVVKTIRDETYSEEFIGNQLDIRTNEPTGKTYKVTGSERSGIGGGIYYSVQEVTVCECCGQTTNQ